jgi:predicted nucleic acid-binding protein
MRVLLDVNTLVALVHEGHTGHKRVRLWYDRLDGAVCGLCSITELGFVRVSVQARLIPDVATALSLLKKLKEAGGFELWPDAIGADRMPAYVKKPAELTDGHLLELAKARGAALATLDTGILGATIIP